MSKYHGSRNKKNNEVRVINKDAPKNAKGGIAFLLFPSSGMKISDIIIYILKPRNCPGIWVCITHLCHTPARPTETQHICCTPVQGHAMLLHSAVHYIAAWGIWPTFTYQACNQIRRFYLFTSTPLPNASGCMAYNSLHHTAGRWNRVLQPLWLRK